MKYSDLEKAYLVVVSSGQEEPNLLEISSAEDAALAVKMEHLIAMGFNECIANEKPMKD